MKKIEKLTEEQTALIAVVRSEWLARGLSTAPADRAKAEAAITRAYAVIGKPAPQFVWAASPLGAQILIHLLKQGKVRASVWDSVRDSVGASVRDSVGASVWASVGASVGASVWASVGASVGDSVRDSVGASVGDSVRDSVGASVGDSVRDSVGASVRDSVGASVRASVGDSVWDSKIEYDQNCLWACHDVGWLAFYDYFKRIGVGYAKTISERWEVLNDLADSCMWWWPYEGVCVICDRPEVVQMEPNGADDRQRLHCETGPAVKFRDGWSIYSWHGVRVPGWIIEAPEQITPAKIDAEPNAEIRRCMIERFPGGMLAYMQASGAVVVDYDERHGRLWRKDRANDAPILLLEVQNSTAEPDGSIKTYTLRVHPECRPMLGPTEFGPAQALTAANARAASFGLTGAEADWVWET